MKVHGAASSISNLHNRFNSKDESFGQIYFPVDLFVEDLRTVIENYWIIF